MSSQQWQAQKALEHKLWRLTHEIMLIKFHACKYNLLKGN